MAMFVLGRYYAPADPSETFTGKTVIVTGSNTGLGFAAAAKFVQKDAQKVIMAVRTVSKGEEAKRSIVARHGHEDRIEVWELDMGDYESIEAFAKRVNTLERLDIALLNAGVYMTSYATSKYSWEQTIQINTISTTLLAILLLPKLKQSKAAGSIPVLEFTSSGNHARVDTSGLKEADNVLEAYNDPKCFKPALHYGLSKLLLMFVLQTLAATVDASSTLVNSVCPGMCQSDLSRGFDGFFMRNVLKPMLFPLLRTPEQGARTLVSGATLDAESHGRFWQHDILQPRNAILSGDSAKELQPKVWDEIVAAIRKDFPEIDKAVERIRSA